MLKKKYKPSRLNKWYTKHFVLTPCMRGVEVSETVVVWWCFMSFLYNDSLLNIICTHGTTYIEVMKKENDTYVQQLAFNANCETMFIPSRKGQRERYFKQINGIIYEITYDTPPDE